MSFRTSFLKRRQSNQDGDGAANGVSEAPGLADVSADAVATTAAASRAQPDSLPLVTTIALESGSSKEPLMPSEVLAPASFPSEEPVPESQMLPPSLSLCEPGASSSSGALPASSSFEPVVESVAESEGEPKAKKPKVMPDGMIKVFLG